jgi:hypothetical protein
VDRFVQIVHTYTPIEPPPEALQTKQIYQHVEDYAAKARLPRAA